MRGFEWDLLEEVFAPVYSPSTEVGLDFLEQRRVPFGGSLLEVGCGAGLLAVLAAKYGCRRVVASDVNPHAVRNAALNAARHGVADRVEAVHCDMFSGIDHDERFDTIFWSSNYVYGPCDYEYRSLHERAYVDAGYRAHRAFLEQAPLWLSEGGTALLHFSSRGDHGELENLARRTGRLLRTVTTVELLESEYGADPVRHLLLEVLPVSDRVGGEMATAR
ncbi:50S ribosomal protein L11 methyltransferase [Actinopolyspora biskrensis]|nr:50S ribosomal protein L11 methyltransferase [Actinopolyspora biskrensis]